MRILRTATLSSKLPFQRRHYQDFNENGHKDGFYQESSTSRSISQNPNNKRALTQTRHSYDTLMQTMIILVNTLI
ncbi:unnamed protein product [Hymenolepis diminuta]|uniref:Uncharacterized protein n=1 Tax=Hymenolepis diminuta TaxID=6216 RepID=A0A564YA55_HYMDI|nr:unnamed protein product [Hymenolepis diminuta]